MLIPDLSRRVDLAELMDSGCADEAELERALSFLDSIDRLLGGRRLMLGALSRWLRGRPAGEPVSVLDVGTGGAYFPLALEAWARRRGLRLTAVGLDSDPRVAALARRRAGPAGVEIVEETLERFARAGRRFDFVTASLMLHHVPEEGLAPALRAMDALARRGVIVSDLRRCAAGYLGARSLTRLAGDRLSRHDGPVSVRRGFTLPELQALAGRAGLGYLRARAHWAFRLSLSGLKSDG